MNEEKFLLPSMHRVAVYIFWFVHIHILYINIYIQIYGYKVSSDD